MYLAILSSVEKRVNEYNLQLSIDSTCNVIKISINENHVTFHHSMKCISIANLYTFAGKQNLCVSHYINLDIFDNKS